MFRLPWSSTVEHNRIVYEVVDTVDTPSDVTDPETLINEQNFSQASPVEHHPTASDEATCTTALQSIHGTDQQEIGERCHLCLCFVIRINVWCTLNTQRLL